MSLPVLLRDVFHAKRDPSLYSLLNLLAIEEDILIGADLQFSKVFRLSCPDTSFFNETDLGQHATAIGRLIDSLPSNCTAQLIVRVRWDGGKQLDQHVGAKDRPDEEMLRFVRDERIAFLKGIPFKTVEHFLVVTTHPSTPDLSSLRIRPHALKIPDFTEQLRGQHIRRVEELKAVCNNAVTALRDARIGTSPLNDDEIVAFLYNRLNPAMAERTKPPKIKSSRTLRSQIALNACENGFDTTTIDGYHHRAINLKVRPTMLDGRAMHLLVNQIPGDFDLVFAIHSLAQDKAEKTIKAEAATAFTLSNIHITRYHEASLKTQDADDILAHTKATFQKLYLMSCHVVIRDVDLKTLTSHTDAAGEAFRRLDDSVGIVEDKYHLPLFLATMPGHSHLNPRTHLVHTEVAARFLTMSASWNGTSNPQVMFPTDDGKLIGIDLFSPELTAKHSLILGVSGEGKSVLTNTLLTSFSEAHNDNNVIIIDDGGSYRKLCERMNGQYLEPTLDGKYSFNPFLTKEHAFDENGLLDADFLSFITLLVQLMVGRASLTNNEKSIIQKCVLLVYKSAKAAAPLLGDLRTVFQQFKGDEHDVKIAGNFNRDLELWTEGTYGRLLNQQSTFDASSRFIVFDLHKMTQEDLKPVLLLIIKSVIHPKLANKKLRKIIALDEVWKFLREKAGADLVIEWYKTGRRFNTGVCVITQSAEDLLQSAAAAAISENSTVKWILNLGGGYDKLHKLKFTEEAVEAIKQLGNNPERTKYRKVFVSFGNRAAIIHNRLSPTAYRLYTTDPKDINEETALREQHPDWSTVEILRALVERAA